MSDPIISKHLKTLTLLCVEDDKTTQILYQSIFEDIVKEIIFAYDGDSGYQKYIDIDIDIIITDYDMPILNGIDMSELIKISNKDIPIILVSAIEEVNIIVKALKIGINNFVQKPIASQDIISAVEDASKMIIANDFLHEQKNQKINELQQKESYNSYQEDLAFSKELNILRNDFYYQMIDAEHISLVDFLYQPLDVISGDAYTARRIDSHRTFYLIVDGMGKGLSASLTAMIMTSFVNHIIDKMIEYDSFSFDILVKESMGYIQPILLDEEAVAVDYIMFDTSYDKIIYAKFAMPVMLIQDKKGNVIRLKSNNAPLCKWQVDFSVDEYNVTNIDKFLFYSDGIVENETIQKNRTYADFIEDDFKNSFTREDLKKKFFSRIDSADDDITLIFINRLPLKDALIEEREFVSTLHEMDSATAWYEELWSSFTDNSDISYSAGIVFTELYMNAYEHGNLGIDSYTKHKLLEDDIYIETLQKKEVGCIKKINIKVSKILYEKNHYIITQITDEGDGFDTQILSEIFRNSATFNGRGVFVSRKNSLGIYYNSNGTSVLYLHKI